MKQMDCDKNVLGELTLAREEALRIGPQEIPGDLQLDVQLDDLEHGDYINFIHGIHFHVTTREDVLRDIDEVRGSSYTATLASRTSARAAG